MVGDFGSEAHRARLRAEERDGVRPKDPAHWEPPREPGLIDPQPPQVMGVAVHDITTEDDRVRCVAYAVTVITVAPDLEVMARDGARARCAIHVDPSLPSMSWHAGPPRGGVAAALPYASPLAQAMIDISQRCYDAEWLNTLAGDLWAMVHAGAAVEGYGNEPITAEEIANLRALASASGCWCDWSEAEGRPVDVPLGEWLGRFWNVKGGAK